MRKLQVILGIAVVIVLFIGIFVQRYNLKKPGIEITNNIPTINIQPNTRSIDAVFSLSGLLNKNREVVDPDTLAGFAPERIKIVIDYLSVSSPLSFAKKDQGRNISGYYVTKKDNKTYSISLYLDQSFVESIGKDATLDQLNELLAHLSLYVGQIHKTGGSLSESQLPSIDDASALGKTNPMFYAKDN